MPPSEGLQARQDAHGVDLERGLLDDLARRLGERVVGREVLAAAETPTGAAWLPRGEGTRRSILV